MWRSVLALALACMLSGCGSSGPTAGQQFAAIDDNHPADSSDPAGAMIDRHIASLARKCAVSKDEVVKDAKVSYQLLAAVNKGETYQTLFANVDRRFHSLTSTGNCVEVFGRYAQNHGG